MEAIEFETVIHDGIVNLPVEYSSQWEGKKIRVIVLDESDSLSESGDESEKKMLKAISLNTKGFKFNREDANTR
ncbi:hypothetical protein [Crocosphaera sp.]|uniref:hypothetical protein n=1 Tax=Crocosphaera sp. TaxID=2729996 RepID=UPI0026261E8D|nr:hypothetical protein [Crocosphaera sp.]MDJ0580918.1 hypothetical protein [Crocosphaera sp.]